MTFTVIDCILMFVANFFTVFLLGLQSRNVVAGKYLWAALTSFGISMANFTFIKYAATGDPLAFVLCAVGGCLGIVSSIWFYERMTALTEEQRKRISDGIIWKPNIQLQRGQAT